MSHRRLRSLQVTLKSLDYLEIAGTCNNAIQAIERLNNERIDLIFLDINMPKLTGIQMLKTISHPPKVIITSAHKDYALEAFELDAVDYLLKPVSFERFLKAVNKFCKVNTAESEPVGGQPGFLYFRSDRKMVKVFLEDITFIESFKDYVVIHRKSDGDLKVKNAISSVENMLPRSLFLRIHRSYIVSLNKVTAFTSNEVEIGKTVLPIGKSYPDAFKQLASDIPNSSDIGVI